MKISREIKIGAIFVIGITILILGVNYLRGKDIFNRTNEFFAVYEQVNGLVVENPVFVKGIKIGQVKEIYFNPNNSNQVIIKLIINKDIPIPNNSISKIFSSDLMGSKAIEIIIRDSKIYAQNGDTLISEIQATLQEEVNKQVLPLKKKTEDLILSIDTLLITIQSVLNKNTRDNLQKSFENIQFTVSNLQSATSNIDTLVSSQQNRLRRIITNVESITFNLKNSNDEIVNIIHNFSSLSDSLVKVDIASTFNKTDIVLSEFSDIIDKINNGEGSIGLLLNNDSLYYNLESSSKNLDELLDDVKLNPKRYVHFSLFGRGEKKNKYREK